MTKNEATIAAINEVVTKLVAAGHHDAASRLELAREYFLNSDFKKSLEQHVYEINASH